MKERTTSHVVLLFIDWHSKPALSMRSFILFVIRLQPDSAHCSLTQHTPNMPGVIYCKHLNFSDLTIIAIIATSDLTIIAMKPLNAIFSTALYAIYKLISLKILGAIVRNTADFSKAL